MTQRYALHENNIEAWVTEDSDGEFVHYSDYEKLVESLRLIRRHGGSQYSEEIAEAALLSAGEEL